MTQREYEILQEALRTKLNRPMGECYMSDIKEGIYREGILTAMSILSNYKKKQENNT